MLESPQLFLANVIKDIDHANDIVLDRDLCDEIDLSKSQFSSETLINDLYDKILKLRMSVIDNQCCIKSYLLTFNDDQEAWVRVLKIDEALTIEAGQQSLAHYNYLRLFYAYLIAALTLSRIYHFDTCYFLNNINYVRKLTTESFLNEISNADIDTIMQIISEGKGYLVKLLNVFGDHLSKETISELLDQFKDWVALEGISLPIVTIIKTNEGFGNKNIIILDEPCTQLTLEQRDLFINLNDKKWYQELTPVQQQLVDYYKEKILSANCVIPSQLRSIIPVCKNAYKQSIFIHTAEIDHLEEINAYFHSGTVAHLGKNDQDIAMEVTRYNLLQQKMIGKADAMIMICLNSYIADSIVSSYEYWMGHHYNADDSEIIKLTHAAASTLNENNIYYAKICLNGFRMIEFNDYTGINKMIDHIKQNLFVLRQASIVNFNIKEMEDLMDKINNLQWQFTFFDRDVKGLDIIYFLTKLNTLSNQFADTYSDLKLKKMAVWFGCASGENRTGITFFNNICHSIIDYFKSKLNQNFDEVFQNNIFSLIAKTQHIHIMTGNQGGTFGTEGIRNKSSGSLKKEHPRNYLLTQSSDVKKIDPIDHDLNVSLDAMRKAIQAADSNKTVKLLLTPAKRLLFTVESMRYNAIFIPDTQMSVLQDLMHTVCEALLFQRELDSFKNIDMKINNQLSENANQQAVKSSLLFILHEICQECIRVLNNFECKNTNSSLIKQSVFYRPKNLLSVTMPIPDGPNGESNLNANLTLIA